MEAGATRTAATVRAALCEYYAAPGRYQLGLRQPALLFASIKEILQIAAGPRDAPRGSEQAESRSAAQFFIRAAMLFPGADHYALFGLAPKAAPGDLKERYRLLMRLIHPDYTDAAPGIWPADAALRVNRAYEVLSSPVLRREYDEHLGRQPKQRPDARQTQRQAMPPRLQFRISRKTVWMGLGAASAAVALLLLPHQEPTRLVQKSPGKSQPSSPRPERQATPPGGVSPKEAEPVVPMPPVPESAPGLPVVRDTSSAAIPIARDSAAQVPPPPMPPVTAHKPSGLPQLTVRLPGTRSVAPPEAAGSFVPAPPVAANRVEEPRVVAAAVAAPGPSQVALNSGGALPPAAMPVAALPAHVPAPSMHEVQPLLTDLLQVLESGNVAQLLRMMEPEARSTTSAQALSRRYAQLVRGARPIRLTQVEFRGEPREDTLHVTGRMRVHAGETPIGSHGERLAVQADFASRGGKVVLIGLSGAPD